MTMRISHLRDKIRKKRWCCASGIRRGVDWHKDAVLLLDVRASGVGLPPLSMAEVKSARLVQYQHEFLMYDTYEKRGRGPQEFLGGCDKEATEICISVQRVCNSRTATVSLREWPHPPTFAWPNISLDHALGNTHLGTCHHNRNRSECAYHG